MTTKRNKAFTLPELIIGLVIILLVMGGVVATLKSGLDVFFSSEANGKVTTGVRFTVASFKREILPMVNGASSIEILKDMSGVPATISGSGDYYIYRSTDCTVKCRSAAGDVSLNGSEYISSLDFTVPKASADKLENFMLSMDLEGQDPNYKTAYLSLDLAMALVGKPEKSNTSNASGSYYTGGVLHFSAFNFKNLNIRDASEGNKVLADSQSVAKGDALQVHYDISVPAGKKDATKILWYARTQLNTEVAADKDKSIGYYESTKYASVTYSDTTAKNYWWPLLVKSNDKYYLASELYKSIDVVTGNNFLEIPTSNDKFYVYTGQGGGTKDLTDMGDFEADGSLKSGSSGKAQPLSEYCFLRAWVVPSYSDSDGTNVRYPSGYAQWSTRVNIRETGVAGQKFFNDWMLAIQASNNGTSTTDQLANHWQNSTGETANAVINGSEVDITGPHGSNLIQFAKVISPDYLNDARRYDMAVNGGKSYTSPANYTIIIDAKAGVSTAGIGLLLNGYRNNGRTSGYVFYYDPGANGYPIRLQDTSNIVDGYAARGVREIESPQQADTLSSSNKNDNLLASNITDSSNQHGRRFYSSYYNPQYVPSALQNNIFNSWQESDSSTLQNNKGDDTNECKQMQARRRYMITVLEYYTSDEEKPRLLVRMRLLKNLADVIKETSKTEALLRAEDPFLDGPEFYYSEPAWYGVFVGQKPGYDSASKKYSFKAVRPGDTSAAVVRTIMDKDDSAQYYEQTPSYYAVQTPSTTLRYKNGYAVKGRIVKNSKDEIVKIFNGGVYKGTALDPRTELGGGNNSASVLGTLGPSRSRWMGIALWGGQVSNKSSIELYNMTLAPGFDESELRAIMETDAKVFGIDEIISQTQLANETYYSAASDSSAKWNGSLFGNSKASAGNGNMNMSNDYANRFTNASGTVQRCVMSLQHTGGANCGCPMCRVYQIYQDATKRIKFW
mgnify:CR=1 FL=1